jgi:hypothetical protein
MTVLRNSNAILIMRRFAARAYSGFVGNVIPLSSAEFLHFDPPPFEKVK